MFCKMIVLNPRGCILPSCPSSVQILVGRPCLRVKLLSLLPASWWKSSHCEVRDYSQPQHLSQLQPLLLAPACPRVSEKDLNISKQLLFAAMACNCKQCVHLVTIKESETWSELHFHKPELNH